MESLPVEVVLPIIKKVGALDIIHLQQTCKRICAVIEIFDKEIWRNCLRRQCLENDIFWPTYKDLSTGPEFKHASTTALRFAKTYQNSIKSSGFSNQIITTVEFPANFRRGDIQNMALIPGGRFLLLIQSETISLWDLNSLKNGPVTSFSPGHQVETEDVSCIHISCDKIRILLSSEETTFSARMADFEAMITWEVLEITHLGGNVFMSKELCRLDIIYPFKRSGHWVCSENTICEDKVVFCTSGGSILVWDFVQNSYFGGNNIDEVRRMCQAFFGEGHVVGIGEEGVHAFRLPSTLRQVEDGSIFVDRLPNNLSPSFSLFYHREYNRARTGFYAADILDFSSNGDCTLFHRELPSLGLDGSYFHRYQFTVNGTDPATTTLVPQESMKCTVVAMEGISESEEFWIESQTCNGRLGTIWKGWFHDHLTPIGPTYLISIHLPSTTLPSVPVGSFRTAQISELQLVPFTVLTEDEADLAFCSFCSTSGKVAVFRDPWGNDPETESFVQLYHLL